MSSNLLGVVNVAVRHSNFLSCVIALCSFAGVAQCQEVLSDNEDVGYITIHAKFNSSGGTWQDFVACPDGQFAYAYSMQIHDEGGKNVDDTRLNAVRLHCVSTDGENESEVTTGGGRYGDFYGPGLCGDNEALYGYRLRHLPNRGSDKDDLGATDLQMLCREFGEWRPVEGKKISISPIPPPSGEFTSYVRCPSDMVIYAVSTMVLWGRDEGLGVIVATRSDSYRS